VPEPDFSLHARFAKKVKAWCLHTAGFNIQKLCIVVVRCTSSDYFSTHL